MTGQMTVFDLLKPPEVSTNRDPYTVYFIAIVDYVSEIDGRAFWTYIYNKRGMILEFPDREHAEYFANTHPQAIRGREYEIRERKYHSDPDQMEYGQRLNVWVGEP